MRLQSICSESIRSLLILIALMPLRCALNGYVEQDVNVDAKDQSNRPEDR